MFQTTDHILIVIGSASHGCVLQLEKLPSLGSLVRRGKSRLQNGCPPVRSSLGKFIAIVPVVNVGSSPSCCRVESTVDWFFKFRGLHCASTPPFLWKTIIQKVTLHPWILWSAGKHGSRFLICTTIQSRLTVTVYIILLVYVSTWETRHHFGKTDHFLSSFIHSSSVLLITSWRPVNNIQKWLGTT